MLVPLIAAIQAVEIANTLPWIAMMEMHALRISVIQLQDVPTFLRMPLWTAMTTTSAQVINAIQRLAAFTQTSLAQIAIHALTTFAILSLDVNF